jgi:dTDP-4-amino-4,6-dideoxygalactose transaminase
MKKIKVSQPFFSLEEVNAAKEVLLSGWITNGPKTLELETIVKKKINARNVIATNSCTSGIMASLIAYGAKKGDEIISPANTFISSINTFHNLGLKIKLCDININTFNIDEHLLENCITQKTKFFIPVHNGGSPDHFDKILKISRNRNIIVIDDAATAFGAKIKNKYIGSYNKTTTVFSLHANKNISSGEGGLVCTNDNFLASKIRKIINNGLNTNSWERNTKRLNILNAVLPGYKFNYNDIHASIAIQQINKFEAIISYRKKLTERYLKNFNLLINSNFIQTQFLSKENKSGHYNFQVLLKINNIRDKLIKYLHTKNISTAIHYTPCYEHAFYKGKFKTDHLINTKKIFKNILSLPLHNHLKLEDVDKVCHYVLKFFKKI